MITKQELEKVIEQINSILAALHERVEKLEKKQAELTSRRGGRPSKSEQVDK